MGFIIVLILLKWCDNMFKGMLNRSEIIVEVKMRDKVSIDVFYKFKLIIRSKLKYVNIVIFYFVSYSVNRIKIMIVINGGEVVNIYLRLFIKLVIIWLILVNIFEKLLIM